jgi:hypothetical protein
MPIQWVRGVEAVEGGMAIGVPAGKLSVSLLSSCRGSGLVGRTSHELEGHGHALLIVRHVCGISRGVLAGAVAVLRADWSGGGLVCLLGYAIGRFEVVDEGGSRLAGSRRARAGPSFAVDQQLQQSRTGAYYTIEPPDLLYASPLYPQCSPPVPSTCSGSAPCPPSASSSL